MTGSEPPTTLDGGSILAESKPTDAVTATATVDAAIAKKPCCADCAAGPTAAPVFVAEGTRDLLLLFFGLWLAKAWK